MWGDESEDENEEEKENKEEKDSSAKNGESQSELVAKDDNKGTSLTFRIDLVQCPRIG